MQIKSASFNQLKNLGRDEKVHQQFRSTELGLGELRTIQNAGIEIPWVRVIWWGLKISFHISKATRFREEASVRERNMIDATCSWVFQERSAMYTKINRIHLL